MNARDAWREVCMVEYRITGDMLKAAAFADSVEQRIRAEVRLATLREVRAAAIALDRSPDNDPYLWGYGGREICNMIGKKVREAREAHGSD